jgi:cytochrome c556
MRAAFALVLAAWLLGGCGGPAQLRYEEDLERTPAPAAHGVHSERLAELMRGLERLSQERLPRAMDVSGERERRADEIASVARAMADSAQRIAGVADALSLAGEERAAFLELAAELQRHCRQLSEDAPDLTPEELRRRAHEIDGTCGACHGRFRIPRSSD